MKLLYREIKKSDYDNIVQTFGPKIEKYHMVQFKKNCYNIAVFDGNKLVGINTTFIKTNIITNDKEAFLAYGAVLEEYRRKGIASKCIKMSEKWAKTNSCNQIGAWSDFRTSKKTIYLFKKLGYTFSQAIMYDKHYLPENGNKYVVGYYYAKRLD